MPYLIAVAAVPESTGPGPDKGYAWTMDCVLLCDGDPLFDVSFHFYILQLITLIIRKAR